MEVDQPDRSLKGKLRRRLVRLAQRRPAAASPSRPMVSFSFDDAPASAALTGAALLEARGLRGTYYIAAGLAGTDGPMGRFADSGQIVRLALAGGVAFDAVALEPPPGAGALPVQLADGRVFGLTPAADGTQYAVYLLPQ